MFCSSQVSRAVASCRASSSTKSPPFPATYSRTLYRMATDTSTYKLNHSMIRVKDPKKSVQFYEYLGLELIHKLPNPDAKFDLYFMAYNSSQAASGGNHWTDRQGVVELTHNYGSESDPNFKIANGNTEPHKGFGHLAISVDNIQAACSRLEQAGYAFQKKLTDGRMRSIAFLLDPDSYWVEIVPQKPVEETQDQTDTDIGKYRMNHTMIRVKDPQSSLKFYQDVMGMTLHHTAENKDAGFNLYFLGYCGDFSAKSDGTNPVKNLEGILELTWNYGTEKDAGFKYHDGNSEPQGFGHICLAVDDIENACQRFEDKQVKFAKKLKDGRMHNLAFALDPDGYRIEIIQNERLKQSGKM